MDAIDWEAFLKGWEGQPTTSPTSSSESELLTSCAESAEPESAFKEPFVELLAERAGLIGCEDCYRGPSLKEVMDLLDNVEEKILLGDLDDGEDDPPLSPKPGKDQYRK